MSLHLHFRDRIADETVPLPVRGLPDHTVVAIRLVPTDATPWDRQTERRVLADACAGLALPLGKFRDVFPDVPLGIHTPSAMGKGSYVFHPADPGDQVREGVEALARGEIAGDAPVQGWVRDAQTWRVL
jgi:hypothetical protein